MSFDCIPAELKKRRLWVCRKEKVPCQTNGHLASSTDPATWTTFENVLAAVDRFDGISIACADGLAGVDLDDCLDADGIPSQYAEGVIYGLDSYTEVTPSGKGLRCLFFGKLPGAGINAKEKLGIELYDTGRFFTVTGHHFEGTPTTVEHREAAAEKLYETVKAQLEPPNPLSALVVGAFLIAARAAQAVDWLTYKFIARGELVLVTAPPGFMKSILLLFWAVCLAAGRAFLGLSTKPARVLWLNTDNGQQTHEDRLGAIMRGLGLQDIPLFSVTTTDFELGNPAHIGNLQLLADDLEADVIIIDTLSGCLPGVNENSAEEMTVPSAHLRALASGGRTIVGIHHPPKNDAEGSRGSSVLTGKVDRHFTVARSGDVLTVKPMKTRNSPAPTRTVLASVVTDPVTDALLAVSFADGTEAKHLQEVEEAEERVLEALAGGKLNVRELRRAVKGRATLTTEALSGLLLARRVSMEIGPRGAKLYSLVTHEPQP